MTKSSDKRNASRFGMIRRALVVLAVLTALLSSQAVAMAYDERAAADEMQGEIASLYELGVVNGTTRDTSAPGDLAVAEDDTTLQKPKVGGWAKCQVPGKCEIGIKITIRF